MRIALLPKERWVIKAAAWNPGLSSKITTNRAAGRPKKGWEDEINQFLKSKETEATIGSDVKNNDRWIWAAKQKDKWKDKEEKFEQKRKQQQQSRRPKKSRVDEHKPNKLGEPAPFSPRRSRCFAQAAFFIQESLNSDGIEIMKDQEVTNKVQQCVEELAGYIFVQSVETTALARMTPVPARGLNERNEQTKRRFAYRSDGQGQVSGVQLQEFHQCHRQPH